jgi:hypothetical protein
MDEELAKKHIKKSLEHADWFVSSVNDIVKMKWGTDLNQDASYYYRSFLRRWEEGTDRNVGAYPKINHYFFLYLKSYEDPRIDAFGIRLPENNRYELLKDTIIRPNTEAFMLLISKGKEARIITWNKYTSNVILLTFSMDSQDGH